MAKDNFYTAIDLGTSKVCTLIARVGADGELQTLGLGVVPSQGVEKGLVVDPREAKEAVVASVEEARRYLGQKVTWAYVGVSGNQVECTSTVGLIPEHKQDGSVSREEVNNLVRSATPRTEPGKAVLHVIARDYAVDGLHGIRNPVGIQASELEVETNVVVASEEKLRNVKLAVEKAGVDVRAMVLAPLAAGYSVLTEDEREMGVVLIDIGCGTTDVGIFRGGALYHNASIPIGGHQITRDLSIALQVPYYYAEEAKLRWGHAVPEAVDEGEVVALPSFQGSNRRDVRRRQLCEPVAERTTEILKLAIKKVYQAGLDRLPSGGVVLTGGTASLAGFEDAAKRLIPGHVRVGQPHGLGGLPPEMHKPAFAASVGVLLWGIQNQGEKQPVPISRHANGENGDMAVAGRLLAPLSGLKETAGKMVSQVKRIYA